MKRILMVFTLLVATAAFADDASKVASQLQDYLKEGKVQVKAIGPLVVIDGEVDLPADWRKIDQIAAGLCPATPPVAVKNLVHVNPKTMVTIADRIEREIGSPEITARFVGTRLFLEGTAASEFEAD